MDAQERGRLKEAFSQLLETVRRLADLSVVTRMLQGPEAHKQRLEKTGVQKTWILFDKAEYLEKVLRADDPGGHCPECGGDHEPFMDHDEMEKLKDFVIETSIQKIHCEHCVDLGWLHVQQDDCRGSGEVNNHAHIERCDECAMLVDDDAAVLRHVSDCSCFYFRGNCDHYNDDEYNPNNLITPTLRQRDCSRRALRSWPI